MSAPLAPTSQDALLQCLTPRLGFTPDQGPVAALALFRAWHHWHGARRPSSPSSSSSSFSSAAVPAGSAAAQPQPQPPPSPLQLSAACVPPPPAADGGPHAQALPAAPRANPQAGCLPPPRSWALLERAAAAMRLRLADKALEGAEAAYW